MTAPALRAESGAPDPGPSTTPHRNRDKKIRGLILAAGQGSRLGASSRDVPKCLLDIGRHSLAEHQLAALADAGIGPTAIVVGYRADDVREAIGLRAEYIQNPKWNRTNSLYSFLLAKPWLDGPAVIMNSDVLFAPEVLERLLEVDGDAIVIDSTSGRAREQMAVEVVNGCLRDMSKDLPLERVDGENVGILKLSAESMKELFAEAEALIGDGHEKSWLGEAVRRLAARRRIEVVDVSDLPWIEIDFPTDLVRARREVWPRIAHPTPRRGAALAIASFLGVVAVAVVSFFAGPILRPPQPEVWTSMDFDGADLRRVVLEYNHEQWRLLEPGGIAALSITGPAALRVDTRLLDPTPGENEYVLEVRLNGARLGWFVESPEPSRTRTHPEWIIGKRERVDVEVGEGEHQLEVEVVAPREASCLIRVLRREGVSEE